MAGIWGNQFACHCLPFSQNCCCRCHCALSSSETKLKLPWARPLPPGLTLIKQHQEAESPDLHSLKIVALPVVLSQTGLSGLGSWSGGLGGVGKESLGTGGYLALAQGLLLPPVPRLLARPTVSQIPEKGSKASHKASFWLAGRARTGVVGMDEP